MNDDLIILDYIILSEIYWSEMIFDIREKSKEGFRLHGAPFEAMGYWNQAMVRYGGKDDE